MRADWPIWKWLASVIHFRAVKETKLRVDNSVSDLPFFFFFLRIALQFEFPMLKSNLTAAEKKKFLAKRHFSGIKSKNWERTQGKKRVILYSTQDSLRYLLVHTTQFNGAFRARWLVGLKVISKCHSPPSSPRDKITRQQFNSRPLL